MSANDVLPDWLLALIGEYGAAARYTSDVLRLHRWELLIAGIKQYATKPTQPSGSEGSVAELQAMVLLLRTALAEAMDWNWLDDDARPSGTATFCDAAMCSVDAMIAAAPQPTTKKG